MARRKRIPSQNPQQGNGPQQYVKLENRLLLLAWLNSLFGYESNHAMLEDCKRAGEGLSEDGRSNLYHFLISRGDKVKIPVADLRRYDENILQHLERINSNRKQKITLRYFQYLAVLYTEIILDRLFTSKARLLAELNDFVEQRNRNRQPGELPDAPFRESDLNKLAYWMATGSGKTLLMHLNYYQFLHYNREPLDNILLITPNEGLSKQHKDELEDSGIPAQYFSENTGGLWGGGQGVVQVIEITKLVEEKRGGGVTVPVEAFEGRNLIFVDEGHKGSGGEAWRKYREALGATGFTFEYSATFGQALSAAGNDALTAEYGKAIVFDYSYKYFYNDGFGKDFRILNLKDETSLEQTDRLLLGNLLSFYEQVRLYQEQAKELKDYNLEKPLWVFVGSTVNAVYKESGQPRSDVLTVVRFFHRFLRDREWALQTTKDLLNGSSGLTTPDGKDVFSGSFPFLRELKESTEALYEDILNRIFHTPSGGGLHIKEAKNSSGELGLKAAQGKDYFGVIYIGDTSAFKKLVDGTSNDITWEPEAIADSLFDRINHANSPLYVLIGARKFMEGWNSWRVSSMGLLNIGKQEGAQIIQLFGRGVRLKGKGMSLKRSTALEEHPPPYIHLLETLNIFAVRANYMAEFRTYLEREGVEPVWREYRLPVRIHLPEHARLVVPRPKEGHEFSKEKVLLLNLDTNISVYLDLSPKVEVISGTSKGVHSERASGGEEGKIPPESLEWVDWHEVYLKVLAHKERKGLGNLVIRPEALRKIIAGLDYTLRADSTVFQPKSFAQRGPLQHAVAQLLCRYADIFYQRHREKWEEEVMIYKQLDHNDPNLTFNRPQLNDNPAYIVRVPHSRNDVIEVIEELIKDISKFYQNGNGHLPRILFDQHLYVPLLLKEKMGTTKQKGEGLSLTPPGLVESEAQFVRDLRDYWEQEKDKSLAGKEVYLLRNLSRGRGIGFFEGRGFYPDFILWLLDRTTNKQCIVFIEPHGMLHAAAYIHDEKARLHERLPALAMEIGKRSGRNDVLLDAYIISATPYEVLYKRYDDGTWDRGKFADKHILFQDRTEAYDYIKILFERLLQLCVSEKIDEANPPGSAPASGETSRRT